jgi:hypothetical protein
MELDGILKAWTIKVRMKRAIRTAMKMGSTYSLNQFLFFIPFSSSKKAKSGGLRV